jgi:cobalamin biosynthesis Co2+ chelatase CbiK
MCLTRRLNRHLDFQHPVRILNQEGLDDSKEVFFQHQGVIHGMTLEQLLRQSSKLPQTDTHLIDIPLIEIEAARGLTGRPLVVG